MNIPIKIAKEIFGLSENFSNKEVIDAYHKLSKITHPDTGGDPNLFQFICDCKKTLENINHENNEEINTSQYYKKDTIALKTLYEEYSIIDRYFKKYNIEKVSTSVDVLVSTTALWHKKYYRNLIVTEDTIRNFMTGNYVSFYIDLILPKEFEGHKKFYIMLIFMGKTYKFKIKKGHTKEIEYADNIYTLKFKSYLKINVS